MANVNADHPVSNKRKSYTSGQTLQQGRDAQAGSGVSGRPATKHNPPAEADLSVEHVAVLGYD